MVTFGLNASDNQIQTTEMKYETNYLLMASDV